MGIAQFKWQIHIIMDNLIIGCEYGDRVEGCKTWHCHHNFGTRNILSDCCSTCNVGDVIHSTVRPFMKTERDTTIMPPKECTDIGLTGDRKCAELIAAKGKYVCYNPEISQICCFTCKTLSDIAKQGEKFVLFKNYFLYFDLYDVINIKTVGGAKSSCRILATTTVDITKVQR